MKTSELVRKAMKTTGVSSAYALAKITGISEDSLKNYENDKVGKNGISNEFARRLAEAAALDVLEVIAELEMERAKDEQTRSAWGKALASIRSSAALVLVWVCCCVVLAVGTFGHGSEVLAITCWLWICGLMIIFIM